MRVLNNLGTAYPSRRPLRRCWGTGHATDRSGTWPRRGRGGGRGRVAASIAPAQTTPTHPVATQPGTAWTPGPTHACVAPRAMPEPVPHRHLQSQESYLHHGKLPCMAAFGSRSPSWPALGWMTPSCDSMPTPSGPRRQRRRGTCRLSVRPSRSRDGESGRRATRPTRPRRSRGPAHCVRSREGTVSGRGCADHRGSGIERSVPIPNRVGLVR